MILRIDRSEEGVVFASIKGALAKFGDPWPKDYRVSLRVDEVGKVVGVTLDGFADEPSKEWLEHKVRTALPDPLCAALDAWFALNPSERPDFVEESRE